MSLNCSEAERRLSRHLDGELPEEQRADLEIHLGDCPACREALDRWSQMAASATDLLRAAIPSQPLRRMPVLHRKSYGGWVAAGVAAAAALLVGILLISAPEPKEKPEVTKKDEVVPEVPEPKAPAPRPEPRVKPEDPPPPKKEPRPDPEPEPERKPEIPRPVPEKKPEEKKTPTPKTRVIALEGVRIEGDVTAQNKKLKGTISWKSGTRLRATKNGAKLLLPDGSALFLKSGSELDLIDSAPVTVDLVRGAVYCEIEHGSFVVRTSHADSIVTGTRFGVLTSLSETRLVVSEGTVTCRNSKGEVSVARDQTTTARKSTKPVAPSPANINQRFAWRWKLVPKQQILYAYQFEKDEAPAWNIGTVNDGTLEAVEGRATLVFSKKHSLQHDERIVLEFDLWPDLEDQVPEVSVYDESRGDFEIDLSNVPANRWTRVTIRFADLFDDDQGAKKEKLEPGDIIKFINIRGVMFLDNVTISRYRPDVIPKTGTRKP